MHERRALMVPWRERGPIPRRLPLIVAKRETIQQACWRHAQHLNMPPATMLPLREFVENTGMRMFAPTWVADMVLILLGVVDRVGPALDDPAMRYVCAVIMQMDIRDRALLYYDACAVLGYDPAEDHPPIRISG